MVWEFYVRKGLAYIPTMARTEAGYYPAIEPVEVVPVTDRIALEQALARTLYRGNPTIPAPTRENFPQPVALSHAGLKSWSRFVQDASGWSIAHENGRFVIAPYAAP